MKKIMLLALMVSLCWGNGVPVVSADPCPGQTSKKRKDQVVPEQTKQNFHNIRAALSIFYGDTEGLFPDKLEQLVPKYLSSLPPCVTEVHGSKSGIRYFSGSVRSSGLIDRSRLTDSGQWGYVNSKNSPDFGTVFIDCKHVDSTTQNFLGEASNLGSLGAIRSALSIFYGDTEGNYPRSLHDLVPKYLPSLPFLSTCLHGLQTGETIYVSRPQSAAQVQSTGKWGYVPSKGEVFISTTEDNLFLR